MGRYYHIDVIEEMLSETNASDLSVIRFQIMWGIYGKFEHMINQFLFLVCISSKYFVIMGDYEHG